MEETKKKYGGYLGLLIAVIVIVLGIVLYLHDWRSDEQIFKDGQKYIEEHQYKKAIEELERIQKNYLPAKSFLGELYINNDSVKNINRGEQLLKEACELNDTSACINLANRYIEKGEWNKTKELSDKLIELGNWKGYRGLAILYWTDEFGESFNVNKNFKKAEFYALKIANRDSWSCALLGEIYSEGGNGIEQDYSKAFYWWKKGSSLGGKDSETCSLNLGWLYYYGYGVKQNYKKAYESFKMAIKQNETISSPYYMLSLMFRNGQYVKVDKDSTKFYLQKASEYGDENATVELENEF